MLLENPVLGLRLAFRIRSIWPWCLLVVYGNSMPVYLQRFVFVFLVLHFIHSEWTPFTFLAHLKNKLSESFDRVWGKWKLLSVCSLCIYAPARTELTQQLLTKIWELRGTRVPCNPATKFEVNQMNGEEQTVTYIQGFQMCNVHTLWAPTGGSIISALAHLWQINSFQLVKRISCSVSHFFPSLILIFLFISVIPLTRLLALDHFSQFSLHFSRPH